MLTAITRSVSPSLGACALTFLPRQPIDSAKAARQHQTYEQGLSRLGVHTLSLPAEPDCPDAVFVEDGAIVVDEVAVIPILGATARQREVDSIAAILARFRPLTFLHDPARLDGGDVMRIGRTLYVGASVRTNQAGIDQLSALLAPYGYQVQAVNVKRCLHLKTGCSYLGHHTIIANRAWVDVTKFAGFKILDVPPEEPWAANVLVIGSIVLLPDCFPQTCALLAQCGFQVQTLDISELMKAEAGLTCMSILFNAREDQHSQNDAFGLRRHSFPAE